MMHVIGPYTGLQLQQARVAVDIVVSPAIYTSHYNIGVSCRSTVLLPEPISRTRINSSSALTQVYSPFGVPRRHWTAFDTKKYKAAFEFT